MADTAPTGIPVVFYRTAGDVEPVREWLRSLPEEDRRVHGFIKKTQKTPPDDLALARKRMQEMKA